MAIPQSAIGSLGPTRKKIFRISARPVGLAVRGACTLALHSREILLEPPFALLRYTLGGDRPSQTGNRSLSEFVNP